MDPIWVFFNPQKAAGGFTPERLMGYHDPKSGGHGGPSSSNGGDDLKHRDVKVNL